MKLTRDSCFLIEVENFYALYKIDLISKKKGIISRENYNLLQES